MTEHKMEYPGNLYVVAAASGTGKSSLFAAIRGELEADKGDVDLPGKGHSVVTEQRSQVAVDRVLAFFGERLREG